jgi:mannitol/fructose-specific phosphotransferase system IIA component (Ntr-type)
VDGEPVRCIFLLLAPLDRRKELYEVLGQITGIGTDKSRRFQLRGCKTADAVYRLLQPLNRQQLGEASLPWTPGREMDTLSQRRPCN